LRTRILSSDKSFEWEDYSIGRASGQMTKVLKENEERGKAKNGTAFNEKETI
jgi:hypothetical protein